MKTYLALCAALSLGLLLCIPSTDSPTTQPDKLADKSAPFEHFYQQRSVPGQEMDVREFSRVMDLAKDQAVATRNTDLPWKQEGPYNIGGRLNCIAVHPNNPDIWFTGASAGGIFRTTDAGESWESVADSFDYLSIADIVFDPSDPEVMYAASGDPNISGLPHPGNGVYKSTDGGDTWSHIGLEAGGIVSKVIVSSEDSNVIHAAVMGLPFQPNTNRGMYRSTDGGDTWEQVLFVDEETGFIDLVSHPDQPDVLFATSWRRVRNNQVSIIAGETCRIWRSQDGGENWEMLSEGLPDGSLCRIGLTISATDPDKVFAVIVQDDTYQIEGIFRSDNGGDLWNSVGWDLDQMANAFGGFGWYFGKIHVNPADDDQISILGVDMWTTNDGGNSWYMSVPIWWDYSVHADKHDMVTLPNGSILLATDGGLYQHPGGLSQSSSENWSDVDDIPNTQFYHVGLDPFQTEFYTGGAQDNGTTTGNLEAVNGWNRDNGGDGFQAYFDPEIDELRYSAVQNGALYYSDYESDWGADWYDFTWGIDFDDRRNWDMPYIMSHHGSQTFYTGTYRMYRMDDAPYGQWYPISEDLTDGVIFGERFHTISTVGESPVQAGVVYCGTTDANVWRSINDGDSWENITDGLPERYVTNIKCSPEDSATVFVTHSGYKDNDNTSYIHMSTDFGDTWQAVSGDLPELPINHLEVWNDTTLFIATDVGVYYTTNEGGNWDRIGNNMPLIPVFDIEFNVPDMELVAATFSRSMMTFPLDSLIQEEEVIVPGIFGNEVVDIETYPNPAVEGCFVTTPNSAQLRVFGPSGQLVHSQRCQGQTWVAMQSWAEGTYVFSLEMNGQVGQQRVVKAVR